MRYLAFALLALPGCFNLESWCNPDQGPCTEAAPDPCQGQCAPFVGGLWSPVVVAHGDVSTCPPVAPFASMASDQPPLLACGVQEAEGECSGPGFVCLPSILPPWTVCVVREGEHVCPGPYPERVDAEGATVCCPGDSPPA